MSIKNSSKVGKRVRFLLDNGRWACGICLDCERTKGRDHSHVDFGGEYPAWVATRDLAVSASPSNPTRKQMPKKPERLA